MGMSGTRDDMGQELSRGASDRDLGLFAEGGCGIRRMYIWSLHPVPHAELLKALGISWVRGASFSFNEGILGEWAPRYLQEGDWSSERPSLDGKPGTFSSGLPSPRRAVNHSPAGQELLPLGPFHALPRMPLYLAAHLYPF